jgi:hypothetical protein
MKISPKIFREYSLELYVNNDYKGLIRSINYYTEPDEFVQNMGEIKIWQQGSTVMIMITDDDHEHTFSSDEWEVTWQHFSDPTKRSRIEIKTRSTVPTHHLKQLVPGVMKKTWCPACAKGNQKRGVDGNAVLALWNIIIHLNDEHKWDRMKIADWLESLDIDLTFKEVNNDNDN